MSRATVTHERDGMVVRQWTSDTIDTRRRLTARRRHNPGFTLVPGGIAWDEHHTFFGEEWTERVTIVWDEMSS